MKGLLTKVQECLSTTAIDHSTPQTTGDNESIKIPTVTATVVYMRHHQWNPNIANTIWSRHSSCSLIFKKRVFLTLQIISTIRNHSEPRANLIHPQLVDLLV
jgi:hypothetical protein